jgi:hypothetical protein
MALLPGLSSSERAFDFSLPHLVLLFPNSFYSIRSSDAASIFYASGRDLIVALVMRLMRSDLADAQLQLPLGRDQQATHPRFRAT